MFKFPNGVPGTAEVRDDRCVVRYRVSGDAARLAKRYRAVCDVLRTTVVRLAPLAEAADSELVFSFPVSFVETVHALDVADCMDAYAAARVLGSVNVRVLSAVVFQAQDLKTLVLVPLIQNTEDCVDAPAGEGAGADALVDERLAKVNEEAVDGALSCDIRPSETGFRLRLQKQALPAGLAGSFYVPDRFVPQITDALPANSAAAAADEDEDGGADLADRVILNATAGVLGGTEPVSIVAVRDIRTVADYMERLMETDIVRTPLLYSHFRVDKEKFYMVVSPFFEATSPLAKYIADGGMTPYVNSSGVPVVV